MKTYTFSTPRVAISIAALAMTALSLALAVLPATLDPVDPLEPIAKASSASPQAAPVLPGDGMPIVVYGVREQETAMQRHHVPLVVPLRKQQG